MSERRLRDHLGDFTLDEVLRTDFKLAVATAIAAGAWEAIRVGAISSAIPVAATLVGVVIGAVVAGAALVAAFMDQSFLRKLALINKDPARYVTPFMFTAVIGVAAALLLGVFAVLPEPGWRPVNVAVAALAVGTSVWALASTVHNLDTLIQFIGLQQDAAAISEEKLAQLERRGNEDSRDAAVGG